MRIIHFTVDGKPLPLARHRDRYDKNGPAMKKTSSGKLYVPKIDPSKKDKQEFALKCRRHKPRELIDKAMVLCCIFYMPVPKSRKPLVKLVDQFEAMNFMGDKMVLDRITHFAKCIQDDDISLLTHTPTPDASNFIKFVEDALNKEFWVDDSRIQPFGWKLYSTKPRTEIEIIW